LSGDDSSTVTVTVDPAAALLDDGVMLIDGDAALIGDMLENREKYRQKEITKVHKLRIVFLQPLTIISATL
jgi:hypothetical protein